MLNTGVKMWKRLVLCVGVLGYLFVVMVARSNMEGAPHPRRLPHGGASTYYHRQPPDTVRGTVSQQGVAGSRAAYPNDQRREAFTLEGVPRQGPREKDVDEPVGRAPFTKGLGNMLKLLAEPAGFISQNNSLKPLFISDVPDPRRGVYGEVVVMKRRYLSESAAGESPGPPPTLPRGDAKNVAVIERGSLLSSLPQQMDGSMLSGGRVDTAVKNGGDIDESVSEGGKVGESAMPHGEFAVSTQGQVADDSLKVKGNILKPLISGGGSNELRTSTTFKMSSDIDQRSAIAIGNRDKIIWETRNLDITVEVPDLPREHASRGVCEVSDRHRRDSGVCRANGKAAECRARLVICQPQLCRFDEDSTSIRNPFLLVIIHSHPSHRYRRDAIRDTWGAIVRDYTLQRRVVFLFLLGSSTSALEERVVGREVVMYRDIVQYELRDNYNNLTVKSVLALDWIQAFCANATYVLKTDDDAFMNISTIVSFLLSEPRTGVLIGSMHAQSEVQRNGQWKVEREVYPAATYPPYCSGTAYAMTSDIARALYRAHYGAAYRDAVLVPMEDVYVTGLLPSRMGLVCNNSKPFPNWTTGPSPKSVGQFLRGEVFGIHGLSHSGMYGLHKLVTRCASCRTSPATLRKWFSLLTGAT